MNRFKPYCGPKPRQRLSIVHVLLLAVSVLIVVASVIPRPIGAKPGLGQFLRPPGTVDYRLLFALGAIALLALVTVLYRQRHRR